MFTYMRITVHCVQMHVLNSFHYSLIQSISLCLDCIYRSVQLVLEPVQLTDGGNYTCVAENSMTGDVVYSQPAQLTVQRKIYIGTYMYIAVERCS